MNKDNRLFTTQHAALTVKKPFLNFSIFTTITVARNHHPLFKKCSKSFDKLVLVDILDADTLTTHL